MIFTKEAVFLFSMMVVFYLFSTTVIGGTVYNVGDSGSWNGDNVDFHMWAFSRTFQELQVYPVYLGEQYVNNSTLSDVTFLVEGKGFYAHIICLLSSSDAFRVMFDGGYRERDAKDIEIPNIPWDIFELMMRYIYTGSVDVNMDVAQDLLRAADQYLLEGLKRLCEYAIAQDISVENVSLMFELSEAFNALSLRNACIVFTLEKFDKLSVMPWYSQLIQRILPETRAYFVRALTRPIQADL